MPPLSYLLPLFLTPLTSPFLSPPMARHSRGKKVDKAVGTGKVTPVQIAFIIDRYLVENSYGNTLAAFRAEANDLFSKTKAKEAPKRLLGLADILDEYINLKEQRVMVDQEKRRLEAALQGIQEVMRTYLSPPSTSGPLMLQAASPAAVPFLAPPNPSFGSPPAINGYTSLNPVSPPTFLPQVAAVGVSVTSAASFMPPSNPSAGSPPAINGFSSLNPVSPPTLLPQVAAAGVSVTPAASFIPPSNLSAGSPPADNGSTPLNLVSPPPFLPLVATADASATPIASFNPSTGSPQDVNVPTSLNPLSPAAMDVTGTPAASFIPPSNPSVGSPSGHAVNGASVMKSTQRPLLPKSAEPNKVSAPPAQCSPGNKRKASRSAPKAPAPKRSRARPTKVSSVKGGKRSTSQATEISKTEQNVKNPSALQPLSNCNQVTTPPVQGLLAAKSQFKLPRANSSSPKTPPHQFPSQTDNLVSPRDSMPLHTTHAAPSSENAPVNYSIISSETVVTSPFKQSYYSVERSYHVTSSPYKSSPKKLAKREFVKGKLHFDEPGGRTNPLKPVDISASTPTPTPPTSADDDAPGTFDYELPDLDMFNVDFCFSDLLADIDLNCEAEPSTYEQADVDFVPGPEQIADAESQPSDQKLTGSYLSASRKVLTEKDMNIQGQNSITTSMTTVSKRITILSPSKSRSVLSQGEVQSPQKHS